MADHDEPSPWQPDPGDAVNPDLTTSVDAEDLDEDRIGLDPLEEGMDPPERWAGSNQYGVGADEQRGESLDQRLAQETDDVDVNEADVIGEAEDGPEQSSEINEVGAQPEPYRQAADEAGGSAARGWRTPDAGDDQ
jgi:hypothetical protein